ncbi:MAG: DUF4982 domain-containing protein [Clostridiales bacterium]|nr:DUF4982 domain-containing protein [Clostridiales bacterium]
MKKLDLNRGWLVKHEGTEEPGKPVTLPHDAMLGEPRTAQSPGGTNTGWFEGHDYRYTRTLDVPEDWRGKAAVLELEGVYHNGTVFLNGEQVGFRPYGYSNFYVDLTEKLRYGQANTLEVVARNADQPNSRWYSGSGLYRPVWLYLSEGADYLPPNAIRVKTLGIDPAQVEITVNTRGTGTVSVQILDAGRQVAAFEGPSNGKAVFRATLRGARLWSPESPNLYTCRATFAGDTAETNFGIRTLAWGPKDGFTLNGQRVILRGACIHHDNGVLGACAYPEAEERKIRLLQENGYNAIRSAHNPCSKALLDACDRLGMLVMDEFVDCWYIHKTKHDYVTYFEDWWRQDLTDMVEKDYNHPSVILYSTGNEVSETAQKKGIALTRQMTDFLHSLDGTRPVTCGINIFFNFLSSMGFGVYSDDKAEKQADVEKPKAVGSQFFNDLAGLLGSGTMKTGATLHGCDVKTRDAFAAMDMAGYNYGIKRYKHDLKKYPNRLILGSETFCSDAYQFWELAKNEPRLIGDFVWAGMDYLGEVGIGAWEYQDYAPSFDHGVEWLAAGSGRIDLIGTPLGEASYTKVAFGLEDGPVIAVRPVNHTGEKHSPSSWKMTDTMSSWNWQGCEGKEAIVEVYSRAAAVELLLNGESLGRKARKNDSRVQFRITYQPGTLTAVAYDGSGRETGRSALTTGSAETQLRLTPEQETVRPEGLAFLNLCYTDTEGNVKPLERHRIRVEVTGGKLLGLGHACPYNPDGFLKEDTDTYYGRALAVVQADGTGPVTVTASDGVRQAAAELPLAAAE